MSGTDWEREIALAGAIGTSDPVNRPSHYTDVVPHIECIEVTEHFGFLRGNAIKYLWRAGSKGDPVEDLRKARWYIQREIENLQGPGYGKIKVTQVPR